MQFKVTQEAVKKNVASEIEARDFVKDFTTLCKSKKVYILSRE